MTQAVLATLLGGLVGELPQAYVLFTADSDEGRLVCPRRLCGGGLDIIRAVVHHAQPGRARRASDGVLVVPVGVTEPFEARDVLRCHDCGRLSVPPHGARLEHDQQAT